MHKPEKRREGIKRRVKTVRYLLTIKYDGTDYHGWQVQQNAVTVQQVMQKALCEVFGFMPGVTGCSRTDSGVHVNMYCCHFDAEREMTGRSVALALNRALPYDIAVRDCKRVPDSFHARYSCTGKQYIYQFLNSPYRDPFLERYSCRIYGKMDEERLDCAAKRFIGEHDFSAFCSAGANPGSNIRTVKNASVTREGEIVTFAVEADGFLYNMVRIMAGTLIRVNEGKIKPDEIPSIIERKSRKNAGPTAEAKGLFLNKVYYPEEALILK